MSDEIFYVYPQQGRDRDGTAAFNKNQWIAAKFLFMNGNYVTDPNPQGSMQVNIYRKLGTNDKIDESTIFANTHNYLIVPANYDPSEAARFAGMVDAGMAAATGFAGPEAGAAVGLAAMTTAFVPGGEQDLQRGERWHIPQGETAPAFRDSASWNLGLVTQMTALPNDTAVAGGAAVNIAGYLWKIVKHGKSAGPTQKLDGPLGMSEADYQADFASARRIALRGPGCRG